MMRSDFDGAIGFYEEALAIRRDLQKPKLLANALNSLGKAYRGKGDFDKAYTYYAEALEINKKGGDPVQLMKTYNSLGTVSGLNNDHQESLSYYRLGDSILIALNDYRKRAVIHQNIGLAFRGINDLDSALWYLHSSLKIKKDSSFSPMSIAPVSYTHLTLPTTPYV